MKTSLTGSTAAAAVGYLLITGALAAPPMDSGMAPVSADFVRVQAEQSPEAIDRMNRLWQHRSILESAMHPPVNAAPAEPLEPQVRPLRTPEPVIATAPQGRPLSQESTGEGQVTCEAAAQIAADFGFSDVGSPDCSGDLYRFSAMRDGTAYAIGIRAATGEIVEVSRQ